MNGLTIFGFHTYRDLNLLLTEKEIGTPEVKRAGIDLEGADGELDMTEFFGEVKYRNVQHRFTFETIMPRNEQLNHFSRIKNALHGKRGRIVLDADPTHFYMGRCFVSSYTNEKNLGRISIECDCEPYKYKAAKTVVERSVNGNASIVLTNSRKRAVPTITATAAMTISFGGFSRAVSAGTFIMPELELLEGENTVNVIGTGTITFTWQEAAM